MKEFPVALRIFNVYIKLHVICICISKRVFVYVVETNPIRSSIMKRDKASFVLGVDISPMLQQILCHLKVVVASCGEGTAIRAFLFLFSKTYVLYMF